MKAYKSKIDIKRLKGYFLILALLLPVFINGSVIAQETNLIKPIRHNFFGTYSRCVLEFDKSLEYNIVEDWIDKKITIVFQDPLPKYNNSPKISFNNLALNSADIKMSGDKVREIVFNTPGDFELKAYPMENPFRLIMEVSVLLKPLSAENSLRRAKIYRSREEKEKALHEYLNVLKTDPENQEALFNSGDIYYRLNKAAVALSYLKKIPEDSKFYASAEGIFSSLQAKARQEAGKQKKAVDVEKKPDKPVIEDSLKPEKSTEVPVIPEGEDSLSQADGKGSGLSRIIKPLVSPFSIIIAILLGASLVLSLILRKKKKDLERKRRLIAKKRKKKRIADEKEKKERMEQFTKKLEEAYQEKTEKKEQEKEKEQSIFKKQDPRIPNLDLEIDEILDTKNESEAVKITKAFRDGPGGSETLSDKYEPVYQLADQNYSVRDIARELLMGIEEVKLALSMRSEKKVSSLLDEKYGAVYELANKETDVKEIARQLKLGQDEVRLALNLREKSKNKNNRNDNIKIISPGSNNIDNGD